MSEGGAVAEQSAPERADGLDDWRHSHTFGQDERKPAEGRTLVVVVLTAITMVAEIAAGLVFGSMALLADGLHMASHATALTINAIAYRYARRHAANPAFSFGTGKVNALGGFTGALLLATFALLMGWESVQRLIRPESIAFDQAIAVAVVGLAVNGASVLILDTRSARGRESHAHEGEDGHAHSRQHAQHSDHNLRSAYLHVLADALTSLLAIGALLAAKYLGSAWADPAVGVVGALVVARWSVGLLRSTSDVLLDRQGPAEVLDSVTAAIEADGDARVTDLHLWSIGPGVHAAIVTVVADDPATPETYRARIPDDLGIQHVSVEVCRRC